MDSRVHVGGSHRATHQTTLFTPVTPIAARCAARLRYWRPFPREVLDVICGEAVRAELPIHTHDAVQVMLPASPVVVMDGARADVVVYPGQVHLAAPQELHGVRSLGGGPCIMRLLLVAPAALTTLGRTSADMWSRAAGGEQHVVVDDPVAYDELWRLVADLRPPLTATEGVRRLLGCLGRLLASGLPTDQDSHAVPRHSQGIARVRDHLRANVSDNVSLDELAGMAGLSKYYLLRAFRRAYGVTPHAFQMRLRLGLAWRLIVNGLPLSRTTYDAGFADQSHLTRRFAATFGLTPARYARLLAVPPVALSSETTAAQWSAAPLPAA